MVALILTFLIILAVLLGPILLKPIERNVELFFLAAGTLTAIVCGRLSLALIVHALREPLALTSAVLVFGIIFRLIRTRLDRLFARGIRRFGQRPLCFGLTIALGLLSGFVTAVVAALVFAEAIALLKMHRSREIAATVFGCFAIGIGAITTPLGMPASTLVLAALHARFWYLALLLWPFVIAGIVLAAAPILFLREGKGASAIHLVAESSSWAPVLIRAGKVYIFIVGLVALSAGIRPIVDAWLRHLPAALLFWINTISAVLDNATLAAIEIGPGLNVSQQRYAILGLLISGGMLIPGNIPNIVVANRLGITSREWAAHGLPTGALLLMLCFTVLILLAAF
jgi:predicted cation transporter